MIVDENRIFWAIKWSPCHTPILIIEHGQDTTAEALHLAGSNHYIGKTEIHRNAVAATGAVLGIPGDPALSPIGEANGVGKNKLTSVGDIGLENAALADGSDHTASIICLCRNGSGVQK